MTDERSVASRRIRKGDTVYVRCYVIDAEPGAPWAIELASMDGDRNRHDDRSDPVFIRNPNHVLTAAEIAAQAKRKGL